MCRQEPSVLRVATRTVDAKRRAPPEPLQRGELQRFSRRLVIEALEVGGQRLIWRQRWLE
eukprot:scaffold23166_cov78-Phaeocystis_antarctica.AAC.1